MPEQSDADDFIPRTVGVELVRIATQCDGVGAESHLIQYMSELRPEEWRCRPWSTQIVAAVEGARIYPWFVAESARAMQIRLWKEVHTPRDGALIHLRGNEATYRGPLLWLPAWVEVSSPKGVILPKYSPSIVPDSLLVVDTRRQAQVHLGAISLRLGPLLEALRRDVGGRLVDRAVDQLRAQKLLPAAFADPSSSGTPADGLKRRIQTALREHRPLSGESYPEWAKRVLPSDEPQSVSNILSTDNVLLRDKSMWKEAGGTPARPGRKKRV